MKKNKPKVIVIGLDGATFNNLGPLMEQGLLPNLKFLVENGTSGRLESTIPRLSPPAWVSFMTGVNPGKHGVFGFVKPFRDRSYKRELISSKDIKAKTIFEILSEYGKKSEVVNLPMTYPPFKFDGFMVSCGLTTPSTDFTFTYPDNLFESIGLNKSEYILNVNFSEYSIYERDSAFSDLMKGAEQKKEISLRLMEKYGWDLFVLVFGGPDRIQHFFWHCIDPEYPGYNLKEAEKVLPLIVNYYQKLDSIIGDFLKIIDENTSLIIMSDHGFGPIEKRIAFHRLLEKNKLLRHKNKSLLKEFLRLKSDFLGLLNKHFIPYGVAKENIKKLLYQLTKEQIKRARSKEIIKKKINPTSNSYWKNMDWEKTFAYAGAAEDTVYLNVKGREPQGILSLDGEYHRMQERIINIVSNIYEQNTKRKLKVKAYKKEDIYIGPYLGAAPDIIFEIEDERYVLGKGSRFKNIIEKNSTPHTGRHTKEGIIILYGNNFKKGRQIKNARIIDLAPTILYLLKSSIPSYMDGEVLDEALTEAFVNKVPVKLDRSFEGKRAVSLEGEVFSAREKAAVEKHLADLGYL